MSDELDKIQHSKRIHDKQTYIKRQAKLAKHIFNNPPRDPHVYHKTSFATCGNSNCVQCGNPRKFWGEQTMQERRLFQDLLHVDVEHSSDL